MEVINLEGVDLFKFLRNVFHKLGCNIMLHCSTKKDQLDWLRLRLDLSLKRSECESIISKVTQTLYWSVACWTLYFGCLCSGRGKRCIIFKEMFSGFSLYNLSNKFFFLEINLLNSLEPNWWSCFWLCWQHHVLYYCSSTMQLIFLLRDVAWEAIF